MLWIILLLVAADTVGLTLTLKQWYGDIRMDLCPHKSRKPLVKWAQRYYPHITPSYFDKTNKTYLISLWHTRPQLNSPLKIYNKEVKHNGNDKGTII